MDVTSTEAGSGTVQYQRQRDIYRLTLKHGTVDVSQLARRFNVTTETIRPGRIQCWQVVRCASANGIRQTPIKKSR